MTYINQSDNGPLCPYVARSAGGEGYHEVHRKAVTIANEIYYTLREHRDDEGEWEDGYEEIYEQRVMNAYRDQLSPINVRQHYDFDRMSLYAHQVPARPGPGIGIGSGDTIEAWYFQCNGCGFVLPAVRNKRVR